MSAISEHVDPPAPQAVDNASDKMPKKVAVVIAVLVMSAFVMILNETILSVALRDLSTDLRVSASTVQWLTSGFLLTMAVVIPITGFLLERFTTRQIFIASLTLFSAGTLLCAVSPGFAILLAGRVIQACGTAVMLPMLMTTVMRLVPVAKRGATMGTITIVIAVAPAVGPTVGGAVLSYMEWRWMFWLVLPLSLAALAIGSAWMRLDTPTRRVPLDVASVVLSAVGFGGLLFGLSSVGESSNDHVVSPWIPIVVGAISLFVFVTRQLRLQRRDRALLDLRPLANPTFVIAVALSALLFMCLVAVAAILLPLYLQTVVDTSTVVSGLAVLPGGLVLGLMGRPVGRIFDRVGARPLVIPGALITAVSLWLFVFISASTPPLAVVIGIHVLLMIGLSAMMTPLMAGSLGALPDSLYSHGSAILTTLQQVAGAFGTAMFVTVASVASAKPAGTPDAQGLHVAFIVAGVVGVAAFVTSLFFKSTAGSAPAGH